MILVLSFLLAWLVAFVTTPIVILYYRKKGWIDDPRTQKHIKKITHYNPVTRGGGVPILISLLISSLILIPMSKYLAAVLIGALILAAVGVWDDVKNLSPYFRLFTGLLAALVVVASGIGIAYITSPFGDAGSVINLDTWQIWFEIGGQIRSIWVWSDLFALIWIVWMMNMVNWSKGVDGQMPGFVSIAAAIIAILSLRFNQDITQIQVTILALITSGSFLGLLFWNAYPQKIMPGYGAGSLAGYLLAVLSILSGAKVATLLLVLIVPTIDAVFTIVRRISRGRSPVWGDRKHLHHLLLDRGWSKKQIAYFYWLVTAGVGLLSLFLDSVQKIYSLVFLSGTIIGILLWLHLYKQNYD